MNAQAEAAVRLGGRYDARVLEPSPPAVDRPPWFADDPVGRDEPAGQLPRVTPVAGAGHSTWADLVLAEPELADWCGERWLAAYRPLGPLAAGLKSTRVSLQGLAERVISPARRQANGKIGLRYTRGGFGTPFFADDAQLRVVADTLVVQVGGEQRSAPITTLAEAAKQVGRDLLADAHVDERPLTIDRRASAFLGDWYGFGASLLEQLRADAGDELEPSRVQLWPEHFDIAVEIGSEDSGRRATYGASPGDQQHEQPYLYVSLSGPRPAGALFGASGFSGAELPYEALTAAADAARRAGADAGAAQHALALRFFSERMKALTAAG